MLVVLLRNEFSYESATFQTHPPSEYSPVAPDNEENFLQTHGAAMGTKMAVSFVNIFMAETAMTGLCIFREKNTFS